ncbi:hypothetical protein DRO97_01885 [Archaeoglobales archaeon]|nr:MAG: hypothetical protein DRO97_01885 [Archaeoglobales archaeon]
MMGKSKVVIVEDLSQMVEALELFPKPKKKVVLKPNLISTKKPPTTTPYDIIEALAKYYIEMGCKIIVAEGSGWCETFKAYKELGYLKLKEFGVKLIDLNEDGFEVVKNQSALFLKQFEFPLTLKNAYIVSVPVLRTFYNKSNPFFEEHAWRNYW